MLLVRYIDDNATQAGLSEDPSQYPHGSGWWYSRPSGPRWLQRTWVESVVCGRLGLVAYDATGYSSVFGGPLTDHHDYLIRRRLNNRRSPDPLDDLIDAAPARVLSWMHRKASLADGTRPGLPVATPTSVLESVARFRQATPTWEVSLTQKVRDAWLVTTVGLLRDLAGTSWVEAACYLGRSAPNMASLYRGHVRLLSEDALYAERVSMVAHSALADVRNHLERMRPQTRDAVSTRNR